MALGCLQFLAIEKYSLYLKAYNLLFRFLLSVLYLGYKDISLECMGTNSASQPNTGIHCLIQGVNYYDKYMFFSLKIFNIIH